MVDKAAVRVTQGELKSFEKKADSGESVTRQFCADCGSPLFSVAGGRRVLSAPPALGSPQRYARMV